MEKIMKFLKTFVICICIAVFISGCSVYMAASKKGTDFEDLSVCKTKTCLVATGAEPLQVSGLPANTEAFKVLKAQGSTGRAVMHGLLDLSTLGIWEIAGTPIEGAYDKDKYYGILVKYELGTENIKQISLAK